ncbi:hypothetical protein Ancab_019506 [Ancistrocladus abbreviatus]
MNIIPKRLKLPQSHIHENPKLFTKQYQAPQALHRASQVSPNIRFPGLLDEPKMGSKWRVNPCIPKRS